MITDNKVFNGVLESHSLNEGLPTINDFNYYDDRTYITNSMLGKLKESPHTLREYLAGGGGISTTALSMGDALHKGMLEPDKYRDNVVVWNRSMFPEPDKTLRTKVNKEWMDNFKKENEGMCILEDNEWMLVEAMLNSLKSKPDAMECLKDAEYEQISLAFINGVPVKSKGDIRKINGKKLIDIKSTSDVSLENFKESCDKYGYYRQAGMYCKMFGAEEFAFLVVEKKAPYRVAIYEVSKEKIKEGWEETLELIEQYKHYFLDDPLQLRIDESVIKGIL